MEVTPARSATTRRFGRAARANGGTLGIVVREPGPEVIYPRAHRRMVVTGGADVYVVTVDAVRQGDRVIAERKSGRLSGRRAGERGRPGWVTLPGARWRMNVEAGATGLMRLGKSGPRGGLPR